MYFLNQQFLSSNLQGKCLSNLQGKCLSDGNCVVYCCTVTRTDDNTTKTYCGMSLNFKRRLYHHNSAERNYSKRKITKLSGYLWGLKINE